MATQYPSGLITTASPWGGGPYNTPWRNVAQWASSVEYWAAYYRVPEWVIIAIIVIESQGTESAYRGADSYDKWPAVGLMQVKPHYWRTLIIGPASANDAAAIDYLRKGHNAIQLGTAVMADGIAKFGSWQDSIRRQYFPGTDYGTATTQDKYINTMLSVKRELDAAGAGGEDTEGSSNVVQIGNRKVRVAIGAGHANSDGGDDFERRLNQQCTNELYKALQADGRFDVRCYTPNNGLGMFPGGLYAAADEVNKWLAAGWQADILHEVHHEGTGTASIRGGFVIYPDAAGLYQPGQNSGDIDTDVRDYGGAMAAALVKPFGGVVRGDGTMSERETGVGAQGYRLGVFGAWSETQTFIDNAFRFITEAATYTNAEDLAKMKAPGYAKAHARGVIAAYEALLEKASDWSYTKGPEVPKAEVQLYPVDVAKLPRLINGRVFYPVEAGRTYVVKTRTLGRQFAAPEAPAAKVYEQNNTVSFVAVVVGDDGGLWGITSDGLRVPTTALVADETVPVVVPTPSGPVVATPPGSDAPTAGVSDAETEMLRLINKYRKQNGRKPLAWDAKLLVSSQWFADDMAASKSFSYEHIDSKGRRWRQRFDSFGFTNKTAGENIGWGYSPAEMLQQFIDSPPHNDNLLNSKFTRIGVGYTPGTGDSGVRKVWVLDFGGEQ